VGREETNSIRVGGPKIISNSRKFEKAGNQWWVRTGTTSRTQNNGTHWVDRNGTVSCSRVGRRGEREGERGKWQKIIGIGMIASRKLKARVDESAVF